MEKRPWSQEQDQCLKVIFEANRPSKWSQVARQMQLRGFKGRNGVQCKDRYCSHINPSHPRDEWSPAEEMEMLELHNELGNKWAEIGKKLGGRSDNSVKNQFYCLLRKSLKRLNWIVGGMERQAKQFKPTILYRVVQVAQQKFKGYCNHGKQFSFESNVLKNQLLNYNFLAQQEDQSGELGRRILEQLYQFRNKYQKKGKKHTKNEAVEHNLLTPPMRYSINNRSEKDQSDHSSAYLSSEVDSDYISEGVRRIRSHNSRSNHSMEEDGFDDSNLLRPREKRMTNRSKSQGNLAAPVGMPTKGTMTDEGRQEPQKKEYSPIEEVLDGLNILGQEADCAPPLFMNKMDSTRSKQSQGDKQELHRFFEDTPIHLTIRLAQVSQNSVDEFGMVDQQ